jgi:Ca-activated chloride channel homolog
MGALMVSALAAVGGAAQAPLFRASADVVVLPVTVTDDRGRFVFGLAAEDFVIADDGVERAVSQFGTEQVPVSLGILLDISGSMSRQSKEGRDDPRWVDTRQAIDVLMSRLNPADEAFLAVFNNATRVAVPWTRDRQRILAAVEAIQPGGDTALFGAIRSAATLMFSAQNRRKVLLLVSDGNDSLAPAARSPSLQPNAIVRERMDGFYARLKLLHETRVQAAVTAVTRSEALVYAIGIDTRDGLPVNVPALRDFTDPSGGYVEPIRTSADLAGAVARLCDDLRAQYVMAFEPANRDGRFHEISVKTRNAALHVRARAGYTATR